MGQRLHRSSAVLRVCALTALAVLSFMSHGPIGHAQSAMPPLTPWRGLMDHVSAGMSGWPTSGWVRTWARAISADGRFVVMDSQSWELVPGDTNFQNDVFLRDRMTGATTRVSVGDGGAESDGWSEQASISGNGRHVAFSSNATNLAPAVTDWHYQVYVRDLDRGRTVHVSVSPAGVAADADSGFAVLSRDGRFVAFLSAATTLVPGLVPYGPLQAYVHDRDADGDGEFDEPGATSLTLVSRTPAGDPAAASIDQVRISGDGRFVLMQTTAALDPTAPVSGDTLHAYLLDRTTGATMLVDRSVTGGASAWGVESRAADLSDDGRYVTYSSISHDIVWLDMNWIAQAFRYDRSTGETIIVSRAADGTPGNGHSYNTSVSSDGRYVAFSTAATNLTTPAPLPGADALVVRDVTAGAATRIDLSSDGNGFDQPSGGTAIAGDGSAVVLTTSATNSGISVYPSYLTNVFVATAFSVAPLSATFGMEGGGGTIDVNTTPVTGWKAESLDPSWITIMEGEALAPGPRTITYSVAPGSSRVGAIRIGQQLVSIRQVGDGTPPVVEPVITGTLGSNGWYVSNVQVSWTVSDPDSPITSTTGCVTTGFAADTSGTNVICQATSGGGTTTRSVTIRRDTTAPNITLNAPQPALYDTGSVVNASFFCADGLSGLAACVGTNPTATPVDTMTPGYHPFTVTATDQAGNTTTRSVEYAIGTDVCTTPAVDLGGWWRMEGNTLNAVSPSTTPATRVGLTSDVYVDAVVGQGYSFQGTNGYLRLNYGGSISNDRKFAIAAWINPTSLTQGAIVSHKEQYRLARLSDGTIAWALKLWNGTFNYVSTGARVPLNVWSHVVVALDVDRVRTFVNGRLVHTYVNAGAIDLFTYWPMTTSMVTVGATEDRGEFFKGGIDEVQVFSRGINPSQVEPMYLAGAAGLCVPKSTTFDVAQPIPAKYGELTYPIVATLRDSDGQPVVGRSVYIESITGAPPYSTSSAMRVTDATGTVRWDAPLKNAPLGLQSESVFLDFAGDPHYVRFATKRDVLVEIGTPEITWAIPAPIVYGTLLSAAELNATANVPGTFTYAPAAGALLDAGTHTLSVEFHPADTSRYDSVTFTVPLEVRRREPSLAVTGGTFTYDGQPHAASAEATGLDGLALGPVEITYDGGTAPPVDAGVHAVTAVYLGSSNYEPATASALLTIEKAAPAVTWPAPAEMVYGAALGAPQLNAAASVPGAFSYSPAAGTVLDAGTHTLTVTFTPADESNYLPATASVQIQVSKAAPLLVWPIPASITYGTALDASQLNASSGLPGTFVYAPAAGTILAAGTHTLSVSFTPDDTANYTSATGSVSIDVRQATPGVTWATPLDIEYGTPLGTPHLAATADVPGTFEYSPGAGTLLNAGTHTLTVSFTPDDRANYANATASVTINVLKATPAIAWAQPAAIVHGTPLDGTQLNATAPVDGILSYDPAAGTVLPAGTHTLRVALAPADAANYSGSEAAVTIVVSKAAPVVVWPTPASIVYGTALGSSQLNATADVPGTFDYSPAAGTLLAAGAHALAVTFTPADTANYTPASAGVTITVAKAMPALSWDTPAPVVYGTALNVAQLNATADVPGTFTYSPAAGTVLPAGVHALAVTFTPEDGANYVPRNGLVTLTVGPAPLTIRPNDAVKVFGAAMPPFSVSTSDFVNGDTLASLTGTLAVTTPATAASAAGTYPLAAGGLSSANYAITYAPGVLTIVKASTATSILASPGPSGLNQPVSFTVTIAVVAPGAGEPTGNVQFYDGDTLLGSSSVVGGVATLSTNGLAAGSHAIAALYSGDANFGMSSGGMTHTVNPASTSTTTTLSSSRNPSDQGRYVVFTATVSSPSGYVTGLVEFYDGATLIGTDGISSGVARLITSSLAPGGHAISARYLGNGALPPSVSLPIAQYVQSAGGDDDDEANTRSSTTFLSASPSPAALGDAVTVRATVVGKGNRAVGGRVLFFVNGTVFGDAAGIEVVPGATSSSAALTTAALPRGTHTISAVYLGDAGYRASAETISLVVN